MTSAELMQADNVTFDQGLLLGAAPLLYLHLAPDGIDFRFEEFRKNDSSGWMGRGVSGTRAVRMTRESLWQSSGMTYVITFVRAFQNIHIEIHNKLPFDALTSFVCSGHSPRPRHWRRKANLCGLPSFDFAQNR